VVNAYACAWHLAKPEFMARNKAKSAVKADAPETIAAKPEPTAKDGELSTGQIKTDAAKTGAKQPLQTTAKDSPKKTAQKPDVR
jgi:hypothetical protein